MTLLTGKHFIVKVSEEDLRGHFRRQQHHRLSQAGPIFFMRAN
jgi:hypothetical protein